MGWEQIAKLVFWSLVLLVVGALAFTNWFAPDPEPTKHNQVYITGEDYLFVHIPSTSSGLPVTCFELIEIVGSENREVSPVPCPRWAKPEE